jgi:hypothetical protein
MLQELAELSGEYQNMPYKAVFQNLMLKAMAPVWQMLTYEHDADKAKICIRTCTCTRLVALRPCMKPENNGEPADLFDILDTGSA